MYPVRKACAECIHERFPDRLQLGFPRSAGFETAEPPQGPARLRATRPYVSRPLHPSLFIAADPTFGRDSKINGREAYPPSASAIRDRLKTWTQPPAIFLACIAWLWVTSMVCGFNWSTFILL